jgi:hypothetical protein
MEIKPPIERPHGPEPLGLELTALQLVYASTDTGAVSSCLQAYINYTRKCFLQESVFMPLGLICLQQLCIIKQVFGSMAPKHKRRTKECAVCKRQTLVNNFL